jgi:predicted kinase
MIKPLELTKPHLLVVVGLPGSGKSFFAKQFGETFGAPYIDYAHFHKLVNSVELGDVVATELLGQLLLTKQTIVIEGRGETREDRAILAKMSQSKGYEVLYIWVQTTPQTAHKRAVLAKDAPYDEQEFAERSQAFTSLESNDPHVVISGRHTYPSQARMVLRRLTAPRATASSSQPRRAPIQNHPGRIIIR